MSNMTKEDYKDSFKGYLMLAAAMFALFLIVSFIHAAMSGGNANCTNTVGEVQVCGQ